MFFDVLSECSNRTQKIWDAMCKAEAEKAKAEALNKMVYALVMSGKEYLTKAEYKKLFNKNTQEYICTPRI